MRLIRAVGNRKWHQLMRLIRAVGDFSGYCTGIQYGMLNAETEASGPLVVGLCPR